MIGKLTFVLAHDAARQNALKAVQDAASGLVVEIKKATRTLHQNAKMWPMLGDIERQVEWDGERMTDVEWKDWFTAALKQQRMVRGMNGGVVFVGGSTSEMDKEDFADLIEIMYAFGAEKGVQWSEPVPAGYAEMAETCR